MVTEIAYLCGASMLVGVGLTLKLIIWLASRDRVLEPGEGCVGDIIVAIPLILASGLYFAAV